jgi:hypothetical protein
VTPSTHLHALGRRVPAGVLVVVYLVGLAGFVGAVVARGGPSIGDAYGVTKPAAALAHGDLHAAAHLSVLPQPPGYVELSAPFVAAFGPLVGKQVWCDGRIPVLVTKLFGLCTADQLPSHRWYESQALLSVLAWMVLVLGVVWLLRAAGGGRSVAEVVLVLAMAGAPAAQDAVVETYHPQDLVCVGLSAAALACAVRRRWLTTGVLFGVAFLCKQFALLPLIAALAAAPSWPARRRVAAAVVCVVGAGLAPFFAVDPSGTWSTLSAVNTGGAVKVTTGTVLGLTGLSEQTKLVIARDGPVILAVVMALWARRRVGDGLLAPVPLVGLATACLAGRLVAEVWFSSYYLLAVSAGLIVIDLVERRPPLVSVVWIAGTAILVERAGGVPDTPLGAGIAFAAAWAAVAAGLHAVWRAAPPEHAAPGAAGDALADRPSPGPGAPSALPAGAAAGAAVQR